MTERELMSRLGRLERDNGRLKAVALATLILATALATTYATRPIPQAITAHEFDVIDSSGKVRAKMTVSQSGAGTIGVIDAQGHVWAGMSVDRSGASRVTLSDTQGYSRAEIEVLPSGEPAINLSAGRGDAHAGMTLSSSGEPTISLKDTQGFGMDLGSTNTVAPTTGETQKSSAASIVMFGKGKEHHVIWSAP